MDAALALSLKDTKEHEKKTPFCSARSHQMVMMPNDMRQ